MYTIAVRLNNINLAYKGDAKSTPLLYASI